MFMHTHGLANLFNYGMLKERLGIIFLLRGLTRKNLTLRSNANFPSKNSTQKRLFTVEQSNKVENTTLALTKPNIASASKTIIKTKTQQSHLLCKVLSDRLLTFFPKYTPGYGYDCGYIESVPSTSGQTFQVSLIRRDPHTLRTISLLNLH